jgi:hypothetical protein
MPILNLLDNFFPIANNVVNNDINKVRKQVKDPKGRMETTKKEKLRYK